MIYFFLGLLTLFFFVADLRFPLAMLLRLNMESCSPKGADMLILELDLGGIDAVRLLNKDTKPCEVLLEKSELRELELVPKDRSEWGIIVVAVL